MQDADCSSLQFSEHICFETHGSFTHRVEYGQMFFMEKNFESKESQSFKVFVLYYWKEMFSSYKVLRFMYIRLWPGRPAI